MIVCTQDLITCPGYTQKVARDPNNGCGCPPPPAGGNSRICPQDMIVCPGFDKPVPRDPNNNCGCPKARKGGGNPAFPGQKGKSRGKPADYYPLQYSPANRTYLNAKTDSENISNNISLSKNIKSNLQVKSNNNAVIDTYPLINQAIASGAINTITNQLATSGSVNLAQNNVIEDTANARNFNTITISGPQRPLTIDVASTVSVQEILDTNNKPLDFDNTVFDTEYLPDPDRDQCIVPSPSPSGNAFCVGYTEFYLPAGEETIYGSDIDSVATSVCTPLQGSIQGSGGSRSCSVICETGGCARTISTGPCGG